MADDRIPVWDLRRGSSDPDDKKWTLGDPIDLGIEGPEVPSLEDVNDLTGINQVIAQINYLNKEHVIDYVPTSESILTKTKGAELYDAIVDIRDKKNQPVYSFTNAPWDVSPLSQIDIFEMREALSFPSTSLFVIVMLTSKAVTNFRVFYSVYNATAKRKATIAEVGTAVTGSGVVSSGTAGTYTLISACGLLDFYASAESSQDRRFYTGSSVHVNGSTNPRYPTYDYWFDSCFCANNCPDPYDPPYITDSVAPGKQLYCYGWKTEYDTTQYPIIWQRTTERWTGCYVGYFPDNEQNVYAWVDYNYDKLGWRDVTVGPDVHVVEDNSSVSFQLYNPLNNNPPVRSTRYTDSLWGTKVWIGELAPVVSSVITFDSYICQFYGGVVTFEKEQVTKSYVSYVEYPRINSLSGILLEGSFYEPKSGETVESLNLNNLGVDSKFQDFTEELSAYIVSNQHTGQTYEGKTVTLVLLTKSTD